mmetsp:Transcript_13009/g.38845  ORF Transcript_13009/g.38845 Transcript_13009/m.38845 type:complete len:339 (-) Transcript_13009:245-1261(-)
MTEAFLNSWEEGLQHSWDLLVESSLIVAGLKENDQEPKSPHPTSHLTAWAFVTYTCALFLINWIVRIFVVQPTLKAILMWWHKKEPTQATVDKMAQSAMEALFYGSSFVVGVIVVRDEPWIMEPRHWFYEGRTMNREILVWYYMTYAARYMQGLVSVLLEHKRKDFVEMIFHHVVTLVLILISYNYNEMRIGAAIMVLFDPADVPLHCAKMFKYLDKDGAWASFWADRCFELFAVSFFVTRIVVYPYLILQGFLYYYVWSMKEDIVFDPIEVSLLFWLVMLLLVNMYWFSLIAKVAYKIFIKGEPGEDIRSDDEDEAVPEKPIARRKSGRKGKRTKRD